MCPQLNRKFENLTHDLDQGYVRHMLTPCNNHTPRLWRMNHPLTEAYGAPKTAFEIAFE